MGERKRPCSGSWAKKVKRLRERLRDQQGNLCPFCGVEMTDAVAGNPKPTDVTLEHIRPLSMGGKLNDDDCAAAWWECNQRRNSIMQSLAARSSHLNREPD